MGGGALAAAKGRGLAPTSWLFHFAAGPWPYLIAGVVLAVVWFAFGKAAQKAAHDREDVRRATVSMPD